MHLQFSKMHGAGNDFVVLDCRVSSALPDSELIRLMGDRHFGIGFDQLLIIEPPQTVQAIASYRIINQDGSFAQQCGNGARCFLSFVQNQKLTSKTVVKVQTMNRLLEFFAF